jgi:anti-anti-sigma regulatory factor
MTVERHTAYAHTVITIDGAFDRAAASYLQELVSGVAAETPLTLDFREVRLFHDSAIAPLAAAISSHPDARLVGLSQHQYRLLQYVADVALGPP